MTYKDWDDRERWEDDSKCIVYKANMGKSEALVCSATCDDIFDRIGRKQEDARHDWKNDCYA